MNQQPNNPGSTCAFVTGLPRTRSAWLAALINAHTTYAELVEAYHELATKVSSKEEYHKWLTGSECLDTLTVDCSSVIDYKMGSKLLVVIRNNQDVTNSLLKLPLFGTISYQDLAPLILKGELKLQAKILEYCTKYQIEGKSPNEYVKFINYSELTDTSKVADCLSFLGIKPDFKIIEQMQELNVQAQYLNTMTFEEFKLVGSRINSMFELNQLRTMENTNDKKTKH